TWQRAERAYAWWLSIIISQSWNPVVTHFRRPQLQAPESGDSSRPAARSPRRRRDRRPGREGAWRRRLATPAPRRARTGASRPGGGAPGTPRTVVRPL